MVPCRAGSGWGAVMDVNRQVPYNHEILRPGPGGHQLPLVVYAGATEHGVCCWKESRSFTARASFYDPSK